MSHEYLTIFDTLIGEAIFFSLSFFPPESMDFGTDSFEFQLHTADGAFRQRSMDANRFFFFFAVIKLTALYFAQSCELIILVRERSRNCCKTQ